MTRRQRTPKHQQTIAAGAATFVTVAILGAPAFAATHSSTPCISNDDATLEVTDSSLVAEAVSHDVPQHSSDNEAPADNVEIVSSSSLLAPHAEAAIREAFAESNADTDPEALTEQETNTQIKAHTTVDTNDRAAPVRDMTTKLPGVSETARSRYRKQMFRRDI